MPSVTPRRGVGLLVLLVLVSAALRLAAARSIPGPFIAPDEMIYALLGRGLWSTGHLSILGGDTPYYSFLYPTFVGLPLSLGGFATGFAVLQGVQALVVSLTAVVVYAWGRRFLSPGWAVAAAALSLTPPALAYSGLVMSEALFLPVVTLAAWALARALETPTPARQALLGLACLAAVSTRLQAVVLLPVVVTAVLLDAAVARNARSLRAWLPAGALLGAAGAAYLAAAAAAGSWRSIFGAYGEAVGSYEAGRAAAYAGWHLAAVFLLCAGIPLLALGALLVEACARRLASEGERALVVTAFALTAWLVLQVGVFASKYVNHLAERDLVGVLPVLFLAFALWLQRGAPRPQPWTALIALAAVAPAVLLPIERFATLDAEPDSFMTIPFADAATRWGERTLQSLWLLAVAAAIVAFATIPRRAGPALAAAVGVVLVAASVKTGAALGDLSVDKRHRFFGEAAPTWVDDAASGRVTLLFAGGAYWPWVWHHVLWNRRATSIVHVPEEPVPGALPQRGVGPRFDGLLVDRAGRAVETPYVVAPTTLTFDGVRVAEIAQQDIDQAGLALWRLRPPVRLATQTSGVQPNGDLTLAHVTVFACRPGRLELTLLPKVGRSVTLRANGQTVQRADIGGRKYWNGIIASPPGTDGRTTCDFDVESEELVGSTRIEYVAD